MKIIRPGEITSFVSNLELEHDMWEQNADVLSEQRYVHEHSVWEVLTSHTTDSPPTTEDSKWVRIGSTNQYSMMDKEVNTKTVAEGGLIEITLQAGRIDSLALLGLNATSVEVSLVVDNIEEFTASANLVTRLSTGTWMGFFTDPLYQQDYYVVQGMVDTALIDLPRYLNAYLTIRIINENGPAECGVCRPGLLLDIGETDNDAETGIEDYTLRTFDGFGRLDQTVRHYSKEISTEVHIYTSHIDLIYGWLVKLKDTPLVWLGVEQHGAYIVYGFGKWRITRKGALMSKLSLEIEGVI